MKALTKRVKQLEKEARPDQGKEHFKYGAGDWTFQEIMQLYDNPSDELVERSSSTDWPDVLKTLTVEELRQLKSKYEEKE